MTTEHTDEPTTEAHRPFEPTIHDDGTISLWGGGPECPKCGGPTHAVTGDRGAERPWWCKKCNVRLDSTGNTGASAR